MSVFRFFVPLAVRYSDLDPQGHVNNARYLSYMEEARIAYIRELGLWDGKSFLDVGIIVAEARIVYRAAITLGQNLSAGVRTARLGNKSLTMEYILEDTGDGRLLATGSTVLVTYDYRQNQTIPVPESWRKAIAAYEQLDL
jgi:acyl-CoA thioester hydrolase